MNIRSFVLPVVGLFGVLNASAQTIQLDLRSALDRAPEANFSLLIANEDITSASEAVRSARSTLLPQLSLDASQGRSMVPPINTAANTRMFVDRFDAVIRANLSLYTAATWDNLKLSRINLNATRQQVEATAQGILQSIGVAYLNHWRSKRRLDVIKANLERDTALLNIARNQNDAGVATPLDVTRAEVRLATNELARLQQETLVLDSALNLKRILNFPMGATLELAPIAIPEARASFDYSPQILDLALNNRPDLKAVRSSVEARRVALGSSKRERLPSIGLTGQWGYGSESWSDDMEEQWSIGIGVSMPLFEGFRIDAATRQQAAALRQAELQLEDQLNAVEAEVRLAVADLDSRFRQITVARKQLALSEREFELARIRFEEGVADNSDVVTAQAALATAEDTLVEAEYQFLLSRFALARAIGDVRRAINSPILP